MNLVKEVYRISNTYPKEELFGLISQTKRAAVSIPSNIAEGLGRKSNKDCGHFLTIARGSGYEVETLIAVAKMTMLLSDEQFVALDGQLSNVLRLLNGLIRFYENKLA